jgi:tetratricopeptide (TPR) repeat protein
LRRKALTQNRNEPIFNCAFDGKEMSNRSNFDIVSKFKAHRDAMREGEYSKADQLGKDVLRSAVELMMAEVDEKGPPRDLMLLAQAQACENCGDWNGAIVAYREALNLELDSGSPFSIWKRHDDLANLYYLIGDVNAAFEELKLASVAARKGDSDIGLRMAMSAEAKMLIRLDHPEAALKVIRDGLAVPDPDSIDELLPANLRTLQAHCEAKLGDTAAARKLLETVWPIVRIADHLPSAAGYKSVLCYWWIACALCAKNDGNIQAEIDALCEAVRIARQIAQIEHVIDVYTRANLMRALLLYANALEQASNTLEAEEARRESQEICAALKLPKCDTSSQFG